MLEDLTIGAALAESVLTSLAVVIAGAWAYFKYFRGRTYRPRLELGTEAKGFRQGEHEFVRIRTSINNRGLSDVPIRPTGTGLRLFGLEAGRKTRRVRLRTFPVFERHRWIEPGERVTEDVWFKMPTGAWAALRMELNLVGSRKHLRIARDDQTGRLRLERSHPSWNLVTIIPAGATRPILGTTDKEVSGNGTDGAHATG